MSLKGEVGSHVLNSHGNYIVDHGKSWNNHGNVFSNFCGNPVECFGSGYDHRIEVGRGNDPHVK